MTRPIVIGLLGGLGLLVVFGGILFGCAGRWDLPFFWAYLGIWVAAELVAVFVVDPGLIRERMRPGPGGKDYATAIALSLLMPVQLVVVGLDVRQFHWSGTVPLALQVAALLAMAIAMAVLIWAEAVNRFFSSVIRIQTERGHHVITSGPYGYLRHPGYASALFIMAGGGLALGSWPAAPIGLLMVIPILRRTIEEDRILLEQLDGYADYARKVRYSLIPGVW